MTWISLTLGALALSALASGGSPAAGGEGDGFDDVVGAGATMPTLPQIDAKYWLNGGTPDLWSKLKGKVVLFDFYDYTCVNCIRTFPYLQAWHDRYKDVGLVLIGIHAPEFEFAKKVENVKAAAVSAGLDWPIVLDNDFVLWRAFGNQYWPAKYLFDKDGRLRYSHFGEGGYGEAEHAIQKLLRELDPKVQLPAVMTPARDSDKEGAVCVRPTPETYLGTERGRLGNAGGGAGGKKEPVQEGKTYSYTLPAKIEEDVAYAEGTWEPRRQSLRWKGKDGERGAIVIDFSGGEANLVIHPIGTGPTRVRVELDGRPLPLGSWGEDVTSGPDGSETWIDVVEPRMYRIFQTASRGRHVLRLSAGSPGFEAFAFTFVPLCEGEPKK